MIQAASEWVFEYAMLKVGNHRSGFEDSTMSGDLDGNLLDLSKKISKWLQTEYQIIASSTGKTFTLSGGEHLIIPLFVSTGSDSIGVKSKHPGYNPNSTNTKDLSVWGISSMSWTIIWQHNGENVAITGWGEISPSTLGTIRTKEDQCFDANGSNTLCNGLEAEILPYVFDTDKTIASFLETVKEPYLIIYNKFTIDINVNITALTPYSLPTTTVTSKSQKWQSSQIFQFTEDKWKYYDALKYGIYNNN